MGSSLAANRYTLISPEMQALNSVQAMQPFKYAPNSGETLAGMLHKPANQRPAYGPRWDEATQGYNGLAKGTGFYGEIPMQDGSGRIMGEKSIGIEHNGKIVEIPSLVPGLSKAQLNYLAKDNDPNLNPEIAQKAAEFGRDRLNRGMNPFYNNGK